MCSVQCAVCIRIERGEKEMVSERARLDSLKELIGYQKEHSATQSYIWNAQVDMFDEGIQEKQQNSAHDDHNALYEQGYVFNLILPLQFVNVESVILDILMIILC